MRLFNCRNKKTLGVDDRRFAEAELAMTQIQATIAGADQKASILAAVVSLLFGVAFSARPTEHTTTTLVLGCLAAAMLFVALSLCLWVLMPSTGLTKYLVNNPFKRKSNEIPPFSRYGWPALATTDLKVLERQTSYPNVAEAWIQVQVLAKISKRKHYYLGLATVSVFLGFLLGAVYLTLGAAGI